MQRLANFMGKYQWHWNPEELLGVMHWKAGEKTSSWIAFENIEGGKI